MLDHRYRQPRSLGVTILLLLTIFAGASRMIFADDPTPAEMPGRRIYVPVEDLDTVLNRDQKGVLLPGQQFQELYATAEKNRENTPATSHGVILSAAEYSAKIADDRLLITATIQFTQLKPGWQAAELRFDGVAIERAVLGDRPAQIGRHPNSPATLVLLNDQPGPGTLTLEMSTPLVSSGSDRLAAFGCADIPSASWEMELPAGRFLMLNGSMLERRGAANAAATYRTAVGGLKNLALRITGEEAKQGEEALVFGHTAIGVRVSSEELTWQAVSDVSVHGKPIDRMTFSIPDSLDIVSIESTGLEGWGFEPNEAEGRTMLTLSYRQSFRGQRRVTFRGVATTKSGEAWNVPNLTLSHATAHTSRIVVQHAANLRLRVDRLEGVRPLRNSDENVNEIRQIVATTPKEQEPRLSSYYAAWQEDFTLAFVTRPKARELQAAIATQLQAGAQALSLAASVSVEPRFAPLFDLEFALPTNWEIARVEIGGKKAAWRVTAEADGARTITVPFEQPLPAENSANVELFAAWQPDSWPIEETPLEFAIPEIRLPQVDVLEGTYTIQSTSDLQVTPVGVTGLDPSRETAAHSGGGERLAYDYQDTHFAGTLRIERKPSRLSAKTLSFARLDPETLHAYLEASVLIDGGGLRTLQFTLPEATGEDLRFVLYNRNLRIVEQQAGDVQEGARVWTLRLDQRYRGWLRLSVDIEIPRGDAETFAVPTLRLNGAERDSGFTAIEGSGEQQLTVTAVDGAEEPLTEVAPEELPRPVAYAPRERIVAAYQHVQPTRRITLSETRFDRLAVPTAICDELKMESILGETGYLQHRATFVFRAVGIQGLQMTLPADAALWSTVVDEQPVEVRRVGETYRVPMSISADDQEPHEVVLSYTTQIAPLGSSGELSQAPPQLAVVGGAGDVQPLEILKQSWTMHHPRETRLLSAHNLYQPDEEPVAPSLLGNMQLATSIGNWQELFLKAVLLIVVLAVLALVTVGFRKQGVLGAVLVAFGCLIFVGLFGSMILPSVQQASGVKLQYALEKSQVENWVDSRALDVEVSVSAPTEESATVPGSTDLSLYGKNGSIVGYSNENSAEQRRPASTGGEVRNLESNMRSRTDISRRGRVLTGNRGRVGVEMIGDGQAPADGPRPPVGGWGVGHPPALAEQEVLMDDAREDQQAQAEPPQQEAEPVNQEAKPANQEAAGEVAAVEGRDTFAPIAGKELGGLLSLVVQFSPPIHSHSTTFQYVGGAAGANGPRLEVDYLKADVIPYMTVAWLAAALAVCWFTRNLSISVRAMIAVLGLTIPLAFSPLAPAGWLSALDGVFLGTLCGVAVWLAIPVVRYFFDGDKSVGGEFKHKILKRTAALVLALLTTAVCAQSLRAGEGQDPGKPQKSVEEQRKQPSSEQLQPSAPPRVRKRAPISPTPKPPISRRPRPAVVVPYDPAGDPQAAERIFLPYDKFVELWNQAYPEKRIQSPAPVEALVAEAMYAAEIEQPQSAESAIVKVTGRVVAYSYRNRQVKLPLPLGDVALDKVEVDGQAAALQSRFEGEKTINEVLLKQAGMHVIDVEFRIAYEPTGPAGRFTLPLKPVAAGALRFQIPGADLKLRVNGSSGAYRRQRLGDQDLAVIPIADGGDLEVSWQPEQTRAGVDGVIHTETATAFSVDDAGVSMTSTFAYHVRQGAIADALFALPADVTVRAIRGADVAGWEIAEEGDARQLRVFLRRKVEDATELTVELFLARQFSTESDVLNFPAFAPQEITRETGRVAVFAGNQFAVTSGVISGLNQIETKNLVLPVKYESEESPRDDPVVAYRYTSRPFQLQLLVRRQKPGLTATTEHAVLVSLRKIRTRSLLDLKVDGAPQSTFRVRLPSDFLLLDVVSPDLADWSVIPADDGATLYVELTSPQTGQFPLEIAGLIPREPDDLELNLQLPGITSADRLRSSVAVWLDPIYGGAISELGTWNSVDPQRLSADLQQRIGRSMQFAFMGSGSDLPPIGLQLTQLRPHLTAAALTTIIAKDTAIEYSIACKWKIARAAADRFVFTTPAWLSGKMDFQQAGYRQITETPIDDERIRWTVELDVPQAEQFFIVANVTLPPPEEGKILAPSILFEENRLEAEDVSTLLETQTQYLMLVNHSRNQLDQATPDAVEKISTDEVQIIDLPPSLLNQAVDTLRVVDTEATVSWDVRTLQRVKSLPASVNLSDNWLVIARDGSWRAQAGFRINNRSRQFLALTLPEESRILSVFVDGQPSRPVQTVKAGRNLTLIALPKTVAGDVSFQVKLVYAGRLRGPLPTTLQARGEEFDLPHAAVVTPKEDEEFGIPVAKTNWTVYLPEDVEVSVLDDPARSNLKLVTAEEQRYNVGITMMQETEEMLTKLLDNTIPISRAVSKKDLRMMEQDVNSLTSELNRTAIVSKDQKKSSEILDRQKRLREQLQKAKDQLQREQEIQINQSQIPSSGMDWYYITQGNEAISEGLLNNNSGIGINIELKEEHFNRSQKMEARTKGEAADGKMNTRRGKLKSEAVQRQEALEQKQRENLIADEGVILLEPQTVDESSIPYPSGLESPVDAGAQDADGDQQMAAGRGELDFQAVQAEQQQQQQQQQQWSEAGGLSLLIDVPASGQKLTLSKVGGGPKLAVKLRPQEFRETMFDGAWMIVWVGVGLSLILALRRPTAAAAITRLVPFLLVIAGGLWYFLLPYPAVGFLLVMCGAVWLALRHRRVTA